MIVLQNRYSTGSYFISSIYIVSVLADAVLELVSTHYLAPSISYKIVIMACDSSA